jgi:hypothetical protein
MKSVWIELHGRRRRPSVSSHPCRPMSPIRRRSGESAISARRATLEPRVMLPTRTRGLVGC